MAKQINFPFLPEIDQEQLVQNLIDQRNEELQTAIDVTINTHYGLQQMVHREESKKLQNVMSREEFSENIRLQEEIREIEWKELPGAILHNIKEKYALSAFGVTRALNEIGQVFGLAEGKEGSPYNTANVLDIATQNAMQQMSGYGKPQATKTKWFIKSVMEGFLGAAPSFILSAMTAKSGIALANITAKTFTKELMKFSAGTAIMSGNEAFEKYNIMQSMGYDKSTSMTTALSYGTTSYFLNKIPFERILDPTTRQTVRGLLSTIAGNVVADGLTELAHTAIDVGIVGETTSVGEMVSTIADTALLSAFITPMMIGTTKVLPIGVNRRGMTVGDLKDNIGKYLSDYYNKTTKPLLDIDPTQLQIKTLSKDTETSLNKIKRLYIDKDPITKGEDVFSFVVDKAKTDIETRMMYENLRGNDLGKINVHTDIETIRTVRDKIVSNIIDNMNNNNLSIYDFSTELNTNPHLKILSNLESALENQRIYNTADNRVNKATETMTRIIDRNQKLVNEKLKIREAILENNTIKKDFETHTAMEKLKNVIPNKKRINKNNEQIRKSVDNLSKIYTEIEKDINQMGRLKNLSVIEMSGSDETSSPVKYDISDLFTQDLGKPETITIDKLYNHREHMINQLTKDGISEQSAKALMDIAQDLLKETTDNYNQDLNKRKYVSPESDSEMKNNSVDTFQRTLDTVSEMSLDEIQFAKELYQEQIINNKEYDIRLERATKNLESLSNLQNMVDNVSNDIDTKSVGEVEKDISDIRGKFIDLQLFTKDPTDIGNVAIEGKEINKADLPKIKESIDKMEKLETLKDSNLLKALKNKYNTIKDQMNNKMEWDNVLVKESKDHHSFLQNIIKEFYQPHHVDNDIFKEYLRKVEHIKQEKKILQSDITEQFRAFQKLDKNEKIGLIESAFIKSAGENIRLSETQFNKVIKDNTNLKGDPAKYYQAYNDYANGMDKLFDSIIFSIDQRFPDLAQKVKAHKRNFYIPMKRKPGNYKVIVKDSKDNSIFFYNEYMTQKEANTAINDINMGKTALSTDGVNFNTINDLNRNNYKVVLESVSNSQRQQNYKKYLFGIYDKESSVYKQRDVWADVFTVSENLSTAVDNALIQMQGETTSDPGRLSNLIKEKLLDMNRRESSLGQILMTQDGIAGLDADALIKNINESVVQAVNLSSRFDLIDGNRVFMDKYFNKIPPDIKKMITRYYNANINNPDVMHQLASKMSFVNTAYHIGGSLLTAIKNVVTAPPMLLSISGEMGVSPVQTFKNMASYAPKVADFVRQYVKTNINDMVFNRSTNIENIETISEIAKNSGFADTEINFLTDMFKKGYITTGITDEFSSTYLGSADSKTKNFINATMTPFKISEIAVRMLSSLTTAQSLVDGGKFNDLSHNQLSSEAFRLTNLHQPRSGIEGRINMTQRPGIIGAGARVATSLLSFTFNYATTMVDQTMKGYDVFKTEKGLNKITKNNYWQGMGAYLGSMLLMGGMGAIPFSEDISKLYRSATGEEDVFTTLKRKDSSINRMINDGVFGLMYIDVPGIGVGMPPVMDGGVAFHMLRKVKKGSGMALEGAKYGNLDKVYRGLEMSAPSVMRRMMRSLREYSYGVSTTDGIALLDKYGERQYMSATEALVAISGVNVQTKNYNKKRIKSVESEIRAMYNNGKRNIVSEARRNIKNGRPEKAFKYINQFNKKLTEFYNKHNYLPTKPIKSVTTEKVDD